MAVIKITEVISRKESSIGVTATEGKKCGLLSVTQALRAKLEAAGKSVRDLPADGTILVGVELGAEFSFNFGMVGNGGAVVPSIRGINPLTGIRAGIEPWTSGRGDFCPADPAHGRLGHNGKCSRCGHTWAAANYLVAAPGADLPGWRTGEGEFRKFVATADMLKDVATAVDASSVVPALGFAFYKSTKKVQSWSPFYVYSWYAPLYRYPLNGAWYNNWVDPYWGLTNSVIQARNLASLTTSAYHSGDALLSCDMSLTSGTVNASYCCNTSSAPFGEAANGVRGPAGVEGSIGMNGADGDPGRPGVRPFDSAMPEPLAVGASKSVTEVTEQKTPTLLPQDLYEEPAEVIDALLVSWEYLTELVDAANSVVASGPMKGIPFS